MTFKMTRPTFFKPWCLVQQKELRRSETRNLQENPMVLICFVLYFPPDFDDPKRLFPHKKMHVASAPAGCWFVAHLCVASTRNRPSRGNSLGKSIECP